MADKHIFGDHATLIDRSLRGIVASNPSLRLLSSLRVVYNPSHPKDEVSIICGGGGGHEPASSGFVGDGMLAASVSGDIFGSPSAKQVLGAIRSVPSDAGTILVVTNYTGDCLHFGLAAQQARGLGVSNVELIMVTDDVAIPRSAGKLVGRRAIGGTTLICKVLGAASALPASSRPSFRELVALGQAVNDSMCSIGASLGHSHVPGRTEHFKPSVDTVELGVGVHNEPGFFVLHPKPDAQELIRKMLDLILDDDDERSFVQYGPQDELVLLINNMGGMSPLECNAVIDEALTQLDQRGLRRPTRIYSGGFVTTLNAPGISISLLNLTVAAAQASKVYSTQPSDILGFLDAPHASLAWVSAVKPVGKAISSTDELVDKEAQLMLEEDIHSDVKIDPGLFQKVLLGACKSMSQAEPELTKWDTIVGDGDCGETVKQGADAVAAAVENGLGADGDVVATFNKLTHLIDDTCGGTLGAIVSIFLAGITAESRQATEFAPDTAQFWGRVVAGALTALQKATPARQGHRTMMDALIPFSDTLASTGDLKKAVAAAKTGAEDTIPMTAKLGRATYVGAARKGQTLPPDPGAMAVYFGVNGILSALQ